MTVSLILLFYFSFSVIKQTETQKKNRTKPVGAVGGWLTVDCEVHPAAVVEGVGLLLQHQDPTLVPALVLGAHRIDLEGGLPMQRGSTWRHTRQKNRKKLRERERKKRHSNSADHQKDQLIQGGIKAIRFNLFFRSANHQMGSLSADREMNQL